MYQEIFLRNVLSLLDEKQMTKQALARKAGMSVSFLSDLTHGKANPSLKIMAALAAALEVPLPQLLQAEGAAAAAALAQEPAPAYAAGRGLPAGMTRVAAVLTDYQAFNVRQWDAANRQRMAKSKPRGA